MRLFTKCPKPPACRECGVLFEQHPYAKYGDLCLPHAKPRMERDRRIGLVLDFASHNWEKLEEQAKAWKAEADKAYYDILQTHYEAQYAARTSQGNAGAAVGGLGVGFFG